MMQGLPCTLNKKYFEKKMPQRELQAFFDKTIIFKFPLHQLQTG